MPSALSIKMKKWVKYLVVALLFGQTGYSVAMDESQIDDLADLTAIFVYLKNDCGYQDIPDQQIRNALLFYAKQNRWRLERSDQPRMQLGVQHSYQDLNGIPLPTKAKCRSLAEQSLGLLDYGQ